MNVCARRFGQWPSTEYKTANTHIKETREARFCPFPTRLRCFLRRLEDTSARAYIQDILTRTILFALNSSSSHGRPMNHVAAPAPASMNANETRPKKRLLRSMLDSESFDDFAPVRSCLASSSPGEKSKLGTDDEPGMGLGASAGSAVFAASAAGGGVGAGVGFAGPLAGLLGGFVARHRMDWRATPRVAEALIAAWSIFQTAQGWWGRSESRERRGDRR